MIQANSNIEIILKFLLTLSCFDEKFTICSSNAALLLRKSGFKFNDMNMKGIRLEDTDLSDANFIRTNLENSRMRRVRIDSANFTQANLKGIDWQEMDTAEVQLYKGHTSFVTSVACSSSRKIYCL